MPSVENFYWVLFENLLKPVELDAWYYYPFGTTLNLSRDGEFAPARRIRREHHALFHFDQEPIWTDNFGSIYDRHVTAWDGKLVRLLANSEHSAEKRRICAHRGMLDWYFFYHGFAALDWYRDSEYVPTTQEPSRVFSSLNHLVDGRRCYRMALTARLVDMEIDHRGDLSFHGTRAVCQAELLDPHCRLSGRDRALIDRMLTRREFPRVLDGAFGHGGLSAQFGHREFDLWQRSFLHVVNETVFYDPKLHLTEKIFKPIVAQRPFILAAAPGNLRYLREYGFQTFGDWIDESYDDVWDPSHRLDHIAGEILRFCEMSPDQLCRMHQEMRPVLEHNKRHFFGDFRRIIVEELVENFDTCIRIWNNGRVDGRELPRHPDLERAKRMLQQ